MDESNLVTASAGWRRDSVSGSDAEAIAAVHRISRASYYGMVAEVDDRREQMWDSLLVQPERVTYLVESLEGVLGFISAARASEPFPALEMTTLYVLSNLFGDGVGSRLHEAFDRERRQDEVGVLEVWAGNRRAIEFYVRLGWTASARTRPGPSQIDYVTYHLRT